MDKALATKLIEQCRRIDDTLSVATALAAEIADDEERKRYLRAIADIIADVFVTLIRPIVKEYPELDPDREQR